MDNEHWWRSAVIYQIYPRSFADSDGDGLGDLRGIVEHLDHLNGAPGSLGVDAVWLSPFYPSPQADFGYDISDYQAVDPAYGTLADFAKLADEVHQRGMRLLVDLVMNHTSDRHPWFLASRSSRDDPKRDWYIWADGRDGGPPNNWLSSFERCGPAWTLDPATGQYYLHSFTPQQPDLNLRNPQVRAAIRDVWEFWLGQGADGFRIDVAHRLIKDSGLRDNPAPLATYRRYFSHPELRQLNMDQPETHEVLRELRTVLDEHGGGLLLGEVPISDDSRLAEYFGADGMHTAFHIAFWEQPWDAEAFRRTVDGLSAVARADALPTYALATHDIPRTVSRYGPEQARVAALMQFTLRGLPCVYYGEEIGMADSPPPQALDVDGRDGQRVPMQWEPTGAGFTTGTPWLPFGRDIATANVRAQDADPGSSLNLYRRLIRYRHESDALRFGGYESLRSPKDTFVYRRWTGTEELLVALNFADRPIVVGLGDGEAVLELSTDAGRVAGPVRLATVPLGALEGVLLRVV
ncbi:alpha-amylase family glycosyl hydrolase [Micromonospora sp. WMMD882]|uniref:alpha-amylase family glycosyl hydrolase n=1 Tax=Micromonospora sp. WMMD882 TaxID=3015151 RepID=UPI00248B956D|nr:alpha-amylase family glycosyl hydrolase [Micromonospora sp. WMMD882]WBB78678.1 alpha-amylase family glycosyl hydrolase [Micromonospora sp. WMMD882]